eukprot:CAMPEP_0171098402 /NCGR_PEP_ID=MMETSP0766_2-20121228/48171_1 /TAXON_ID=439317 /ORGANISM="Gambierdiscus australes, Strain CAWD 149" /LENGTH=53 /DNA_ID=CAMNT_0011557737 /DNA_START=59 /DNA_END=217 /DNA_ORIENTATION=-
MARAAQFPTALRELRMAQKCGQRQRTMRGTQHLAAGNRFDPGAAAGTAAVGTA